MQKKPLKLENPRLLCLALLGFFGGSLLIASLLRANISSPLFCGGGAWDGGNNATATSLQLEAVLHYATSRVTPQQSIGEITVSFDVLRSIGPANFLVFGLGHDSLMWAALNPRGKTLFLEEDPKWVQTVLKDAPDLRAHTVRYRTHLSQAQQLLHHYRSEPDCSAKNSFLRGNDKCRYISIYLFMSISLFIYITSHISQ